MGAVLGVGDQGANVGPDAGIYYTQVNGSNAHDVKTVIFTGPASCPYAGFSIWASLSKRPNGLQSAKGIVKDVAAPNADCSAAIDVWKAKKGGAPIALISLGPSQDDLGATFTK